MRLKLSERGIEGMRGSRLGETVKLKVIYSYSENMRWTSELARKALPGRRPSSIGTYARNGNSWGDKKQVAWSGATDRHR